MDLTPNSNQLEWNAAAFTAFKYNPENVALVNFVKEKGGTGSTSSAASVVEVLVACAIPVIIVDLASKQFDLAVPYQNVNGVVVHETDEQQSSGAMLLRAIATAAPGSVVVAQWPSSAIEDIAKTNAFLVHVLRSGTVKVDVSTIWTMDADCCSVDTLNLMLECELPGFLGVNWPEWNGPVALDRVLEQKIKSCGGTVFAIPALPPTYYHAFKRHRIAPATQFANGDCAAQWEIDFWRHRVFCALTSLV